MGSLTADQTNALKIRATRAKAPFSGRFEKGIRDAQCALAATLAAYGQDLDALVPKLRAYLVGGPAWDCTAYQDGGAAVHDDVAAVLDGNQHVIDELIAEDKEN